MPYIGGGTTTDGVNSGDPDGWVICDGQPRSATDNRFSNVFTILNTYAYNNITNNTANSITPPNLTSKFIYGQSGSGTQIYSAGGAASVPLAANNIPPLNISTSVSDPGHQHTFNNVTGLSSGTRQTDPAPAVAKAPFNYYSVTVSKSTTGISVSASYTNNSLVNVPIVPPYVAMNYIMKY